MLGLRLLHVVARVALRVAAPRRARWMVDAAGRLLPSFPNIDEARHGAAILDPTGTCLSRALTISARLPDSEVVIGVDPEMPTAAPLFAHAWVEVGKIPIRPTDVQGREIARIAQAGSP